MPGSLSIRHLEDRLKRRLRLRTISNEQVLRTYLDTYDWRVYSNGDVIQTVKNKSGLWLDWHSLHTQDEHVWLHLDAIPSFAWSLKDDSLRRKLERIIKVRALTPIALISCRTRSMRAVNKQNKTLLRIELQTDYSCSSQCPQAKCPSSIVSRRIHLYPLKGYKKIFKKTCQYLQSKLQILPSTEDPLITTLNNLNICPGSNNEHSVITDSQQHIHKTVRTIFQNQLIQMRNCEPGLQADIDSEFLHDYRVALRRTRSLLKQATGIFLHRSIRKYTRDFIWLSTATSTTRDMDVYLLSFDAYQSSLPIKMREDLWPLYSYLCSRKQREHTKLCKILHSVRYKDLMRNWSQFIATPHCAKSTLADAQRPSKTMANRWIWRAYRKVLKQGALIRLDSPGELLHELRKKCKKLRYLTEFFRNYYPRKKCIKLIHTLKLLQDNLGEYQDLKVQQSALHQFILDMERETGISSKTRNAINHLIVEFEHREHIVRKDFTKLFDIFASAKNKKIYTKLYAPSALNTSGPS